MPVAAVLVLGTRLTSKMAIKIAVVIKMVVLVFYSAE